METLKTMPRGFKQHADGIRWPTSQAKGYTVRANSLVTFLAKAAISWSVSWELSEAIGAHETHGSAMH